MIYTIKQAWSVWQIGILITCFVLVIGLLHKLSFYIMYSISIGNLGGIFLDDELCHQVHYKLDKNII